MSIRIKVWDLPTRVFHWSLFLLVAAAFITGEVGGNAIEWHGKIGLAIIGLIVFRLVWGFIGSTYARFGQFFPSAASIAAYRKGTWQGVGHNPVGALAVFALLALVLVQAATGLFANDDIAFQGPLFDLVGKQASDALGELHEGLFQLLLATVALHVGVIMFYKHVKKNNLVRPMITGYKEVPEGSAEARAGSAKGGGIVAFIVAVIVAAAAVYGASGAWLPAPPPPPPSAPAPSW